MNALVSAIGRFMIGVAAIVGAMGLLFGRIMSRIVRLDLDGEGTLSNLYKMGVKSLPVVVITALFTGGIMVVQAAPTVERFGAYSLLGWGAGFGTLREVGPLLTALMISGRVGANNTAELGTMVVTEQFDAMRALAIDPISFLIAPRFVGIVVTLFLSTIFADVLALVGAAYAGLPLLGVDPGVFYDGVTGGLLGIGDVIHGLVKSVLFGIVMALSSCQFGMSTEGGAPGVGRAVNSTVVVTATGIFVLDYLVSFAI
ncbi:MAG TPA: ABC transporter permease [Polyangiaceae bacterium]|jgi:phospholipid/cholesterol/gamma-HCH transport system permease protein|nr:ABC transporter permease [Polyangiaceae bacterium]